MSFKLEYKRIGILYKARGCSQQTARVVSVPSTRPACAALHISNIECLRTDPTAHSTRQRVGNLFYLCGCTASAHVVEVAAMLDRIFEITFVGIRKALTLSIAHLKRQHKCSNSSGLRATITLVVPSLKRVFYIRDAAG